MMNDKKKFSSICLVYVLVVIFLVNIFALTHFWIGKNLNVIAIMAIFLVLLLAFILGSVWSLIHLSMTLKRKQYAYSYLPFVLSLMSLVLLFIIPYNTISGNIVFYLDLDSYMKVIDMVENDELPVGDYLDLPPEYSHLSASDKISVVVDGKDLFVMFFVYLGFPDGGGGYVYSSTDKYPGRFAFRGDVRSVEKKTDNWYWVELY